jgi:hypothetical protein
LNFIPEWRQFNHVGKQARPSSFIRFPNIYDDFAANFCSDFGYQHSGYQGTFSSVFVEWYESSMRGKLLSGLINTAEYHLTDVANKQQASQCC